MTLRELAWSAGLLFSVPGNDPTSKVRTIPVQSIGHLKKARAELFRLDDYVVSSQSGGTYWLVPRGTARRK